MGSAPALHPIERSILKELGKYTHSVQLEELVKRTGLEEDQARRGIEWLKFKELASVEEKIKQIVELIEIKSLPERRLIETVKQGMNTIKQIKESGIFGDKEINVAIANARKNQWIKISDEGITVLDQSKVPEEILIEELIDKGRKIEKSLISQHALPGIERLRTRPDFISIKDHKEIFVSLTEKGRSLLTLLNKDRVEERRLTTELITSGKWKQTKFSPLDVEAPAPAVYPGGRHPLIDIIEEVKEIFVGLGFSEIDGPMVQSGFWNFDALFTPQDHPAREMQDTFYISGQRQDIPATKDQIRRIAEVHKKGWGSKWDAGEAERVVLRTHTTPVTLQHLANIRRDVARFFSVGRVFRNEKVSYKHLVEFHQIEGVATAPKASIRDLMGLQKEFYAKMGIKKVKFWPTFFPYTEPSLQSMVYNERLDKWVELFGMGIFRPEVTQPLGIKNPVLAWGGGLERIAMLRFGLDDVRDLYGNKLAWLRSVPRCQL